MKPTHNVTSHQPVPYETTDADTTQIKVWTASIFVTVALGMLSMAALLFAFMKFPPSLDRTPTAAEYERSLPPTPRLQVNQAGDLQQFRAHEEEFMTSYSREPNSGMVHMPIEKAIDIVAARGVLPGTKAPAPVAPVKK